MKSDKIHILAATLHSNVAPFAFILAKLVANHMKVVIQSDTDMAIHERNSA